MSIEKTEAYRWNDNLYSTREYAAGEMICDTLYDIFIDCNSVNEVVCAMANSKEMRMKIVKIFDEYEKELAVVD